jgi:hypothetical protein
VADHERDRGFRQGADRLDDLIDRVDNMRHDAEVHR